MVLQQHVTNENQTERTTIINIPVYTERKEQSGVAYNNTVCTVQLGVLFTIIVFTLNYIILRDQSLQLIHVMLRHIRYLLCYYKLKINKTAPAQTGP